MAEPVIDLDDTIVPVVTVEKGPDDLDLDLGNGVLKRDLSRRGSKKSVQIQEPGDEAAAVAEKPQPVKKTSIMGAASPRKISTILAGSGKKKRKSGGLGNRLTVQHALGDLLTSAAETDTETEDNDSNP